METKFLGIAFQPGAIIAAFFGGIVLAIIMKESNPFRILTIVFIGIFTAIFFGPLIVPWIPASGDIDPDAIQNAAGAISGIGGMAIMNGIIAAIEKVRNNKVDEVAKKKD